jgi:hypothetical protein
MSSRPSHVPAVLAALFALVAIASLTAASPAAAKTNRPRGTITVTQDGDTTKVREITIDDEGIRIIGGHKDVVVPGHAGETHEIQIDGGRMARRVIRIQDGDSIIEPVVIHTHGDNEIVQFFHDAHVSRGETAGTVVALFGNVKNEGVITGDCVSILGSIVLGDSAVIQGDAVSVGGTIEDSSEGSRIDGETVSMPFLPFSPIAMPGAFGLLLFGLVSFGLFVGLAALAGRLFPDRLLRISETISRRTLLSLVLGLLSVPLACVVFLLLLVTVIGIPLAIILPFLFVLAAFIGYVASAYLLGTKLLGRRVDGSGGMFAPILAGTAFVTIFYLLGIPFLSGSGFVRVVGVVLLALWVLIGTVCWKLGFGALLLSRLGQAPRANDPQWYPASSPTTPSAPSMSGEPRPSVASAPPAPPPLS